MNSKGSRMVLGGLAGVLCAGLAAGVGHAGASSPAWDQQNSSQTNQSQQAQSQQDPKTQTFTGKITRTPRDNSSPSHTYVLQDDTHNTSFYLDNETEAAKYDGLKVTVTGSLDTSSNTIHVVSIQE